MNLSTHEMRLMRQDHLDDAVLLDLLVTVCGHPPELADHVLRESKQPWARFGTPCFAGSEEECQKVADTLEQHQVCVQFGEIGKLPLATHEVTVLKNPEMSEQEMVTAFQKYFGNTDDRAYKLVEDGEVRGEILDKAQCLRVERDLNALGLKCRVAYLEF